MSDFMCEKVSETDKKLTKDDVCQRCLRTCYRKDIRYSTYHGYICKHCRIELGFEKDETWSTPFDGTWSY